jgi:hypothetical protein
VKQHNNDASKSPPAAGASTCLRDLYQQLTGCRWAFNLLGFLILMLCLRGRDRASIETAGNCRMNNKQRRSDMTETDTIAPMKGAIQGSHARALPGMIKSQINLKGGK